MSASVSHDARSSAVSAWAFSRHKFHEAPLSRRSAPAWRASSWWEHSIGGVRGDPPNTRTELACRPLRRT